MFWSTEAASFRLFDPPRDRVDDRVVISSEETAREMGWKLLGTFFAAGVTRRGSRDRFSLPVAFAVGR